MNVRLYHPETGGEFAAPDSAVPQYRRAGWVPLAEWKAAQAQRQADQAAGNGTTTTRTAGRSAGADTKE